MSVHSDYGGGEFRTRPLTFDGDRLEINFSTSAVGYVRVEAQDPDGSSIPGFKLCEEIYGDKIGHTVSWDSGGAVGSLAGKPVRLRFHRTRR